MPITDIFFVGGIIFAFVAFGAALAWGDYQTRFISGPKREDVRATNPGDRRPLVLVSTTNQNDSPQRLGHADNKPSAEKVTHRTPPRTEQPSGRLAQ